MSVQTVRLGPQLLEVPTFVDDRGVLHQVIETAQKALPQIARVYQVRNFDPGTIRGFHRHRREWKAFYVSQGSAKFVVCQENAGSLESFVMTDQQPRLLVVPPGFYNGWKALGPDTLLLGFSSATIEESVQDDERVDPFRFGDCWQVRSR